MFVFSTWARKQWVTDINKENPTNPLLYTFCALTQKYLLPINNIK